MQKISERHINNSYNTHPHILVQPVEHCEKIRKPVFADLSEIAVETHSLPDTNDENDGATYTPSDVYILILLSIVSLN